MTKSEVPEAMASLTTNREFRTTAGVIALTNLQSQIEGLERRANLGLLSIAEQVELSEFVAQRGYILGRIVDYERAEEQAENLCRLSPEDGLAYLARARSRARFHRFREALSDLDKAQRLGAERQVIDTERAGIFQAIGEYDQAIALFHDATERQADFASLAALAVLYAELGDMTVAEQFFEESQYAYRGVSPIPVARLEFQRGHMWMGMGELQLARSWFEAAVQRLPSYAPAQGHLAEVEAEFGKTETAINRLIPLTTSSDDPDYCATLARILLKIGQPKEADGWRRKAAAGYNDLLSRHPEAFADHAAAFWLDVASDPQRALSLAKLNLEIRQTPRAKKLVDRATRACAKKNLCKN